MANRENNPDEFEGRTEAFTQGYEDGWAVGYDQGFGDQGEGE